MVFAIAFFATALFFIAILFIPFKSLNDIAEDFLEDYSMDLDIKANEQDDMISAALPQEVETKQDPTKLNKVDEITELAPEQLESSTDESEETNEEKVEDQPPINLNGDDEEALAMVEELPEYPGGMVEFMKWLTATLKYPDAALKQHIEGKVTISFIVNKDGSLSDIKIVKGVHHLLDEEALRVAHLMQKWQPGKEKGKTCRTMIAIPIVFAI